MMNFSMTCSCGDIMKVEAANREEAVTKMKAMMTQVAVDAHWVEKHTTDQMPKPTLQEVHMQIDERLQQVN